MKFNPFGKKTGSAPALEIVNNALPEMKEGENYSQPLFAKNGVGPYKWMVAGTPGWLAIHGDKLEGTAPGGSAANYTIQLIVEDSASPPNIVDKSLQLKVIARPKLEAFPNQIPEAIEGNAYTQPLSARNATGALHWTINTTKPWITIDPHTGALKIAATASSGFTGNVDFEVEVTDGIQTATKNYQLQVRAAPKFEFVTTQLTKVQAGKPINEEVNVRNGAPPITWHLEAAPTPPPWIAITANGHLIGTPAMVGTFPVKIMATEGGGKSVSQQFDLEVEAASSTGVPTDSTPTPAWLNKLMWFGFGAAIVAAVLLLIGITGQTPNKFFVFLGFVSLGIQLVIFGLYFVIKGGKQ